MPYATILKKIVEHKKKEVETAKGRRPQDQLEKRISDIGPTRNFLAALARKERISLIAEIKKASPSAGVIRPDFDPMEIARVYEHEGADAISILTDEEFFQGSLVTLSMVKQNFSLPCLRKDFIIDPYQIYEARAFGADAVLLIVSLLSPETLSSYIKIAGDLGLSCLVEIHTREELMIAEYSGAEIIGINNRDLVSFAVDIEQTFRLLPAFSTNALRVSESGIKTPNDIARLRKAGVDAALIGTAFMKADDIGQAVRKLLDESRQC
ncbi:MAG: indole-3-glycerol phosphate synthase TrpC [Pseudomonadota bacterium]